MSSKHGITVNSSNLVLKDSWFWNEYVKHAVPGCPQGTLGSTIILNHCQKQIIEKTEISSEKMNSLPFNKRQNFVELKSIINQN